MKKVYLGLAVMLTAISCTSEKRTTVDRRLEQYAMVNIETPDLSGITDNGKEVLNLYRFAADEADKIYWKQYFGDKSLMQSIGDDATREYAMVNYGPWDLIDGVPFVDGYGSRPLGANFYPADMTGEEFSALDDADKLSPYTLIRRDENGRLYTQWYHEAFAEHIERIADYLRAAADITIKPSVRNYLLKEAEALKTDDYYESALAWLDMSDSKMDLVIGPTETTDDNLYGNKASYGAFVMLKDLKKTEVLSKFGAMMPKFQQMLPGESAYKTFVPGTESNIFACDAMYYAGSYNAGYKVIAINLPYDPRVQAEKGTRTILFSNIIKEKFNRTVFPIGSILLESEHRPHLDAEAFYWNIVFREVAHGLGVKETVTGKGSVSEALGNEHMTIEEAKANIIGTYLAYNLASTHDIPALFQKEDAIVTFIVSLIRSSRFGVNNATGRANVICYNYLRENGAFQRNESGRYSIDYTQAYQSICELGAQLLKLQATGDYSAAREFCDKYGVISPAIKADIVNIELEKIPVDLRFTFSK
ncbi:MAG: Zn-dependent hydrolase [Bacteroidales bacterium]|nr:Zn-dependent hydrolase [Bacteroidales bacterium]